jgi:hypothetical protein
MIKFVRSLFGLNGSAANRTVLGTHTTTNFDLQEVAYIKDSNNRLSALAALQKKYKGTRHEDMFLKVYEKSKRIHWYLVSRKRIHELELFHIRNTDNFLSTYGLIIDVHRRHQESNFPVSELEPEPAPRKEPPVRKPLSTVDNTKTSSPKGELFDIVEKVKQRSKSATVVYALEAGTLVPALNIPEVSINTVAKIYYTRENTPGKQVALEVSFVSSQQEKDNFQFYVSERLGMKDIYYVGNARIKLADGSGQEQEDTVPVFYLRNYLYAITLQDFRMYPVKITRNRP